MTTLKMSRIRCFGILSLIAATALLPLAARGAPPAKVSSDLKMYLKIEGIDGDVKDAGFEKAIEIVAYSWGASQSGSFSGAGGGGAGKANFQDLSMTKYFDASTPPLVLAIAKGSHISKATLTLVRQVNKVADNFMVFEVENVMVTSLSTGASSSQDTAILTENFTLNFGKAKLTYRDLYGKTETVTLDIAANLFK